MCLGIPGQLIEIIDEDFRVGTVEVSGVRRSVILALLPDEVVAGDWVLVHVGFALARIDEEDAQRTLAWLGGEADPDEPPST
jgi:hydrogenase expression/formation protein HypC